MNIKQYNLFEKVSDDDYNFLDVCENLEEYEKDYVVNVCLKYFRRNGFPHYQIENGEKITQMDKLSSFNHLSLFNLS